MKIILGLSGGLDSTYAAHVLREQGHEVIGASVIMHEHTDIASAIESAKAVGIPHITIDAREAFKARVISRFLADYTAGRTPNPCVECNPAVKFAALCDYAGENGFDAVSTGHYASVLRENGRYFLRQADDGSKDQSYVLWRLTQEQLSMLYLPLAGMKKSDIREKASALGYKAAEAKESQEICFIPDDDYVGYIERALSKTFPEGDFLNDKGEIIGRHKGLIRYTVGQRKGLGAFGQPMFVSRLDPEKNTVTLVPAGGEFASSMTVNELNFGKLPPMTEDSLAATVKVRYSAKPIPCRIVFADDTASVIFEAPVRAVTPGQSAVFYEGGDVLFGGIITSV
jgi:tRNA-specific 2-thiouridylase